ncbi:uncharacterized protein LOC115455710 [Manduca sexta]|uniref:BESS domain-containing protein n=1 Tax=Manduca sexta TaxID=7130 RepID=A0A921YP87_MANSE|nr:uncharacterized protein LOC115455710 [Manduca sexta]KAG6443051.1 hypothetical protein O3G_MSEX002649 [Manduca sexta]
MAVFNPVLMIEEVQKRPALYKADMPADREEKLSLWKEIGAVMYPDWDSINKATAYDRVLQLQRKWRSLRDAYNRELRSRRSGNRTNKRTYRYFKRMRFLGGYDGNVSDGDESVVNDVIMFSSSNVDEQSVDTTEVQVRPKRKKRQREPSSDSNPPEEIEMPVFPIDDNESDTDKLFLLSFLPEMRQLPIHIKMWVRAQIANVMQEAVSNHYNNTLPGSDRNQLDVKRQRLDSIE